MDSSPRPPTPESGGRAGYDGAKQRKGSKVHAAVDTLGHISMLQGTPADVQDRAQVAGLAEAVQAAAEETVDVADVDQSYTGAGAAEDAAVHVIRLDVARLPGAKRGFVLLPRRWVVERNVAWAAETRRLARDYERLERTLAGVHFVASALLASAKVMPVLTVL